jgi:hypothetical protein
MYWEGMERLGLSIALKLGLYLVTLACLADLSSSLPK